MSEPIDTIQRWCEFGEFRVYILMIIARRKFNKDLTHNTEIVHRRVIRTRQDIPRCYRDLLALTGRYDNHFRVYLSVNARNTLDGYFNFRQEMDGWIRDHVYGDENAEPKFARAGSRWKSRLHKPECKDDSYFLFDVDGVSQSEIREFQVAIPRRDGKPLWVMTVQTPNGYHVVTEPFEHPKWEPPVEYDDLDTDGQLFISEHP